jgi:hypothetical protein
MVLLVVLLYYITIYTAFYSSSFASPSIWIVRSFARTLTDWFLFGYQTGSHRWMSWQHTGQRTVTAGAASIVVLFLVMLVVEARRSHKQT